MKDKKLLNNSIKNIKLIVFDFDGVFTDNKVIVCEDGKESVICNRSDGIGLSKLRQIGIKMLVLSKEKNRVVSTRCKKLKINCFQGIDNKLKVLKKISKQMGLSFKKIAYMGNDINDLDCMKIVGLPITVKDAYPEIRAISLYITKKTGGSGAVREFADLLVAFRKRG